MDIEDAFTQEAIANTGVDVDGEDEAVIRGAIRKIATIHEVEFTRPEEDFVVLTFIAGRAFQEGNQLITIEMSRQELVEYSRYLVATKGAR